MYNNFFTNCYIKKFLPLFGKFARLAGKNRLSEQTSKHPSLRPAARVLAALLSEQTSKHQQLRFLHQPSHPGAASSFVRTDKQASRKVCPAARASSSHASSEQTSKHGGSCCQAGPAGKLLSEQTSKQLSTGYPQSVVSYPQVTAE